MPSEIICFGETLWDLLPGGAMPGGAPMNVAIHLANAGVPSALISRIGPDQLGEDLAAFLRARNVNLSYLQTDPKRPTGVVRVDLSSSPEATYEIVEPAAWDAIKAEAPALAAVQAARAFVYGTLSARQALSRQTLFRFLDLAPYKVLDVNFRAPFYDQETTQQLLRHAHLVKMNHHELQEIADWYGQRGPEKENMQFLAQKFGWQVLLVTKGEHGALALQHSDFTQHPGFPVTVVDTVGSGDAFLAAFLARFLSDGNLPLALASACLLGALVATHAGATPLLSSLEIARFTNSFPAAPPLT